MDETGTLTMSSKELNRLEILGRVLERRLTQVRAAEQLGLGVRQVERLCRKLRIEGPSGLVSKKRGRGSNRRLIRNIRKSRHGSNDIGAFMPISSPPAVLGSTSSSVSFAIWTRSGCVAESFRAFPNSLTPS
jgi:hypothetical protein